MDGIVLHLARADNGVIGRDGGLPWHLPADLKRFRAQTMGRPMIMGRRTFESFPKALPGRRHLVLTRDAGWRGAGAETFPSLEAALAAASPGGAAVIGGAAVFAQALPLAARIELTEVRGDFAGDTVVPPFGPGWREAAREEHAAEDGRPAYGFVTLVRA